MDFMDVPVRWPLWLMLVIVSLVGLIFSIRNERRYRKETGGANLQDTIFRWPLALTFLYALIAIARTILAWIEPSGKVVGMLEDPPLNACFAAFANGLLMAWVSVYALFLYLRRRVA